ncbi:MAG TPA: hypothetical protein VK483_13085 [Chitinophagaceae bacterium]|nr:hypothetical protein [Chitinophagaceae bacterium]
MENMELLVEIAKELGLSVRKDNSSLNRQLLADKINELLNNDFQKLVSILYRMDVSEIKLKLLLKDNPERDAAKIIADLMIERQVQKMKSKIETKNNNQIPDNEKW